MHPGRFLKLRTGAQIPLFTIVLRYALLLRGALHFLHPQMQVEGALANNDLGVCVASDGNGALEFTTKKNSDRAS